MKTVRHKIEDIELKIKQLEQEADELEMIACAACDGTGEKMYLTKGSYIIDTCLSCRGSGEEGD